MDITNFWNIEIVDILFGTVDSKLVVNLNAPDRTGVKRSNTNNINITLKPSSFNKSRPSENCKTDSKIAEYM